MNANPGNHFKLAIQDASLKSNTGAMKKNPVVYVPQAQAVGKLDSNWMNGCISMVVAALGPPGTKIILNLYNAESIISGDIS